MTAKQFLDAFSETLMQDERILTPRERELLLSILQNSRTIADTPEIQSGVNTVVSRSVGEAVAQRAFALLGGSIVEQILRRSSLVPNGDEDDDALVRMGPQPPAKGPMKQPAGPQPPAGPMNQPAGPQPPAISGIFHRSEDHMAEAMARMGPQPPAKGPMNQPAGPQPPAGPMNQPAGPQPPAISGVFPTYASQDGVNKSESVGIVGVLEAPATMRALVLDEFLAPQELEELISYTLQREPDFKNSEVVSPTGNGRVDYNHRRSRVLMDLGKHEQVILERIRGVLPSVLEQLGMGEFPVSHTEAQITASNDGDFFGQHCDNSDEMIAARRLTFVYFFHREPRQFEGGELRLHDTRGRSVTGSYQAIAPRQNQIVFFPCSVLHEITRVECPSQAFADSRFTLNGWLHN
jgi:Rps23 Pro-64 3,4-dihydroxylase Tpa1-like proline 4-hydroxylase